MRVFRLAHPEKGASCFLLCILYLVNGVPLIFCQLPKLKIIVLPPFSQSQLVSISSWFWILNYVSPLILIYLEGGEYTLFILNAFKNFTSSPKLKHTRGKVLLWNIIYLSFFDLWPFFFCYSKTLVSESGQMHILFQILITILSLSIDYNFHNFCTCNILTIAYIIYASG